MKGKSVTNFDAGTLAPAMMRFAIPLILTSLMQMLYSAVDVIVVGRFVGSSALGAVGSTAAPISLFLNIAFGLSAGAGILMAQAVGARDYDACERTVHTSVLLGFMMGVFTMLLGLVTGKLFLEVMGTPEELLSMATLYVRIYFLGIPGVLVCNFGCALLRAAGDSKRPMIFLAISGVVNVVLDLLFVAVIQMGVVGAAVATVTAQYVSAILTVLALRGSDGALHLDWKRLKLHKTTAWQVIRLGVPIGLQGAMFNIANVLVQSSVNSLGADAMAGHAAADSIGGFIYIVLHCIGQTATTFAGQNYGAKQFARVRRSVRWSMLLVCVAGVLMGVVTYVFGENLIRIYCPENIHTVQFGMMYILYINCMYTFYGVLEVFSGTVRGMGVTFAPMLVSVVGICGVRVGWVYTVFRAVGTLPSLYMAYPVSWAFTAAVFGILYLIVAKKKLIA